MRELDNKYSLIKAKNSGKARNTLISISHSLRQLSQHADLREPEQVKTYLANNDKISNVTKTKLVTWYDYFCRTNGLQWEKPHYKTERKIPLIPTTENINKIISASSEKYATISILAETGLEAKELATMKRNAIDIERGIINAEGCKGHNSRSFKLKQATADLLRVYLTRYTENNPFPSSRAMGEIWRRTRDGLAKKINEPQLKNIPMRNLRHHFATMKYDQTKDILLVKQLLGHKKIETMFYTQLITFNEEDEYTVKTATNIKEATDLLEHGFTYIQEIDGIRLYRKRK